MSDDDYYDDGDGYDEDDDYCENCGNNMEYCECEDNPSYNPDDPDF